MKKKILVLDDKSEFRRLTKAILSNKYDVETAENGLEALSILQGGNIPDLIVSDLMMPVLGGEGFLEQIKKSGALKSIPLIFLSSIDDVEQREKLMQMGANDYLLKPYNPAELLAHIEVIFKSIDSKSISESQKR
ncbi:MAG TPA: response regulator transcription factor [Paludibacter sp.]|jgi:CheY-like chemotaxis protein|nr:response regulator transcription factor [Paludibacter sp.]